MITFSTFFSSVLSHLLRFSPRMSITLLFIVRPRAARSTARRRVASEARPLPSGGPSCGAGRRRRSRTGSAARRRPAGRRGSPGRPSRSANAEEDEGADHPGVDRADPGRRQREEVGDHAEEEALDDDRQRHVDPEGVERGPEHADARRPVAGRAEHRQPALARDGRRGRSRSGSPLPRSPAALATMARRSRAARSPPCPRRSGAIRLLRSGGIRASSTPSDEQQPGDRGRDDRQLDRAPRR